MPYRDLPVRPDLDQLRHQAKDLLRALRAGDPAALDLLREHHPGSIGPAEARLADAQLAIARMYRAPGWPRLVAACELIDAIWRDDLDTVRALVIRDPAVLTEPARIQPGCNWGPPLSYAANLGRDRIIRLLHDLGARDHVKAIDRALLQSQTATAALLHQLSGGGPLPANALEGPAYTLSVSGTEAALAIGGGFRDPTGTLNAPVDVVLETDSRHPAAKHRILELYAAQGVPLPDTPTMAVHRGRIDLLDRHLHREPELLERRFAHEEIFPPGLGCHDEVLATHGTPLAGATLLHLAIDYDEVAIVHWLLDRGMDPDITARVDRDGFGGHSPLFATVVSQPAFWMNLGHRPVEATLTGLLLERGADPTIRASLRKQLHPGYGPSAVGEYRGVTALEWGERFHDRRFVNPAALTRLRSVAGR